ncbi:permease [Paenibacillus swuensis]|uniref:Permease n=1 Tax=Paenibacillus swuensis TaxID=1178515 RepID=A0A172TN16_9BACL|nr:sporulation integral membrane protein YtvI [Paenibacillus swuensis]ANE48441.1 permease [Paenibacillus swuensis]
MDRNLVRQMFRGLLVIIAIVLACLAFYYGTPLLYPFVIGWLLAYMLNPIIAMLQQKAKFPRWLAVTAALVVFIGIVTTFMAILVTRIVVETGVLLETIQNNLDKWIDDLLNLVNSDVIQGVAQQLSRLYEDNPDYQETVNNNLSSTAETLAGAVSKLITAFFDSVLVLIKLLPNIATIAIVILLATFFISKNWERLKQQISDWFPDKTVRTSTVIWSDLQKALFGYLRAQLILISITAAVVIIGLLILKVKYAITIGLLIGLVDLLPYLGTGAVMVPWIAYVYIYGDIRLGVGLSVLYGIILVARQILEPKVLASSVGLDPLATLISMFVGLKLFGVLGLIIGPVTLVILSAFAKANVFRDLFYFIRFGPRPK